MMRHRIQNNPGPYLVLILAAVGILAAVLAVFYLRSRNTPGAAVQTIPLASGTSSGGTEVSELESDISRVSLRLSEGQAQPETVVRLPLAIGEPLPEDEIARILARLPEIEAEPEDQVDFRLAQDPIPPPLTGDTIDEPFPPPPTDVSVTPADSGPLEVLRFAPEGEIPIAPFVSVTFNQPMVPLATLGDLAAEQVPVQIEPALPGTWRWLGTKTLTFEYDSELIDRLPKATVYRVSDPGRHPIGHRRRAGGDGGVDLSTPRRRR